MPDQGFGSGQPIQVNNGVTVLDKTFTADITNLPAGVHQMFARVSDANGKWSISNRTFFYKPPLSGMAPLAEITRAEYFFDADPGFGSGQPIQVNNGVTVMDKTFTADITNLPTGVHQMFVRVRDANGKWSISNRTFFSATPRSHLQVHHLTGTSRIFY